jgi:hypothetical protein
MMPGGRFVMRRVWVWLGAGAMLAAAAWIVWGTTREDAPETSASARSAEAPVARAVPAPQPAVPAAAAGEGVGPDAPESPELPRVAWADAAGGADPSREPSVAPLPEDRPGFEGGSFVPGSDPDVQTGPDPVAQDQEELEDTEVDAARCAEALGLWSEPEIQGRVLGVMRRNDFDESTARRHVLARLLLGYHLAVDQLGADAPPAALKERANQISFLESTLTQEQQLAKLRDAVAGC